MGKTRKMLKPITKLLAELTKVETPFSLEILTKTYAPYLEYFHPPYSEQEAFERTWQFLNEIYQVIREIEPSLPKLILNYEILIEEQNPSLAKCAINNLIIQLSNLEHYQELLVTQRKSIVLNIARLGLHNNETRRREIIAQLQQQQINPLRFTPTELGAKKVEIFQQQQTLQTNQQPLISLQLQLSHYLSQKKYLLEITLLEQQRTQLTSLIQDKNKQLENDESNVLNHEALQIQFHDAPNKQTLLKAIEAELAQKKSLISLSAWFEWTTQPRFNQEIERKTLEMEYMQQLLELYELYNQLKCIDLQLAEKSALSGQDAWITDNHSSVITPTPPQIPIEITQLLSLKPDHDPTTLETTHLDQLNRLITLNNEQQNTYQQQLTLLNALESVEKVSCAILQKTPCTSLPINPGDLEALKKTISLQQEMQLSLDENLQSTTACLISLRKLIMLTDQIKTYATSLPVHHKVKKSASRPASSPANPKEYPRDAFFNPGTEEKSARVLLTKQGGCF